MYLFNRINFPLCSFMIVTRHYIVTCIMNNLFFNMNNNNLCYFRNQKCLCNTSMLLGKVQRNRPWAFFFVCRVIYLRNYESFRAPIGVVGMVRKTATILKYYIISFNLIDYLDY